jgi:hypothetical protein
MARPVGWRAVSIRLRAVANSVRSHYDRADLAALFNLKERSMFALMGALPKVHVGRSVLVERASLMARTVASCRRSSSGDRASPHGDAGDAAAQNA